MAALADLVGDADLSKGRLLQRQRDDDRLDLWRRAVCQKRPLAGQFLKSKLAARLVER